LNEVRSSIRSSARSSAISMRPSTYFRGPSEDFHGCAPRGFHLLSGRSCKFGSGSSPNVFYDTGVLPRVPGFSGKLLPHPVSRAFV
jgi:hypothetical protein